MTDHLPVQRRPPTDQRRPAARDAMAVTLGELAQAAVVVDAVTTAGQVDLLFRGDEMLSSVVVTDGSLVRLVSRPLFELVMVGPLGFGRSVWSRRPLSAMGTSPALVLPSETPLGDAASRSSTGRSCTVTTTSWSPASTGGSPRRGSPGCSSS